MRVFINSFFGLQAFEVNPANALFTELSFSETKIKYSRILVNVIAYNHFMRMEIPQGYRLVGCLEERKDGICKIRAFYCNSHESCTPIRLPSKEKLLQLGFDESDIDLGLSYESNG